MKVLVPLDNSEYALKALYKAIDMVKKEGGELVLVSIAPQLSDMEGASAKYAKDLDEQSIKAVEKGRKLAEQSGIKVTAEVESGPSPADNIIKLAEESRVDLIVMGHRGMSGLNRFLVGSVASRVVAHAPCSVLVVR